MCQNLRETEVKGLKPSQVDHRDHPLGRPILDHVRGLGRRFTTT